MKVYLDNNHKTMTDPQVLEVATPFWTEHYSSHDAVYQHAKDARVAYSQALEKIYASIHAPKESQIAITSGADESNTRLLNSIYLNKILTGQKNHIIISQRESRAMMEVIEQISAQGTHISILPIDSNGIVDVELLKSTITPKTALVSVSMVDRESGAVMPIDEMISICRDNGVPIHTDATQAMGKAHMDVQMLDVDYLTLSAEVIHGIPGTGVLYIKDTNDLPNLIQTTNNIAGVVALGKALEQAIDAEAFEMEDARELRDELEEAIREIDGHQILVPWTYRAPHTIMVGFDGIAGDMLLWELGKAGIYGYTEDGRELVDAMEIEPKYRHTLVGFALSRYTTKEEIDYTIAKLKEAVEKIRTDIKGESK
jgi:cysteine desulfurase